MASGGHKKQPKIRKYIHDLPYSDFQKLCDILDCDNKWEELGGTYLNIDLILLQRFSRALYQARGSPTKELLIHWKTLNGTINQLYVYLSKMKHFQAMQVLHPYVSDKVKILFPKEPGYSTMLNSFKHSSSNIKEYPDFGSPHRHFQNEQHFPMNQQYSYNNPYGNGFPVNNFSMYQHHSPKIPEEQYVPQCCQTIPNAGFSYHSNLPPKKSSLTPIENFDHTSLEESLPSKHILSSPKIQNTAVKYPEENRFNSKYITSSDVSPQFLGNIPKVHSTHLDNSITQPIQNASNHKDYGNNNMFPHRKLSDENNAAVRKISSKVESLPKKHPGNINNVSPKIANKCDISKENNTKRKFSDPLSIQSQSTVLHFPFEEICAATCNFTTKQLGRGGFGVVYYGEWKHQPVAIKFIQRKDNPGFSVQDDAKLTQSLTELKTLDSCRHDNILPLYGYCLNDKGLCLIYRYMCNGSLEDRLRCKNNTPALTWYQRCQIIKGIASGIDYLHSLQVPLIHGDIKSANILLDKNLEARLGDFGLVRKADFEEQSYIFVKHLNGTKPYLPDEYLRNHKLSKKLDTYSFGVVLYEVATAERAYDEKRPRKTARLVDYVAENQDNFDLIRDKRGGEEFLDIFKLFIHLGQQCTQTLPRERPEFSKIVSIVSNHLQTIDTMLYARKKSLEKLILDPCLSPDDRLKIQNQLLFHQAGCMSHLNHPMFVPPKISLQDEGQLIPQQIKQPKVPVEQTTPVTHITTSIYQPSSSLIGLKSGDCSSNNMEPPSYNKVIDVSYRYPPEINDQDFSLPVPIQNTKTEGNSSVAEADSKYLPNLSILNNQFNRNTHENQQTVETVENQQNLNTNQQKENQQKDAMPETLGSNPGNLSHHHDESQSDAEAGAGCRILEAPLTAKEKDLEEFLKKIVSIDIDQESDKKLNIEQ